MGDRYAIPGAVHRAELVIDRSRFVCTLAHAPTAAAAQAFVSGLNAEFPDASHHCWAYLIGPPGNTDRVGMSDDGEPHGTAGRPMLTVLLHSDLGDVVAVVSRWFGGVKLGTGGLVRAYSASVQEALLTLPRREHREYVVIDVIVAYAQISACQQLWPPFEASVLADRYDADVRFTVRCPLETEQALRQALLDATRGQAVITRRALLE